jgi:putative transcriptional regulator
MKFVAGLFLLIALLVPIACPIGDARGADLSRPVMLVATSRLAGSVYEQTVVVAAPLPEGGHIGFIINRPTNVKLETLFPDQAACHQVVDPVYVGGPRLPNSVFALTRKAPDEGGSTILFTPGLFAAVGGAAVDRVIETTPTSARFFVGAIIWMPDELDQEVVDGAWDVRAANVDAVFRANSANLWDELRIIPPAPELKLTWT